MSDKLVRKVREENYVIQVFNETKDSRYVKLTTEIVKFVQDIYRHIEPSHFSGEVIAFYKVDDSLFFDSKESLKFYDSAVLNNDFKRITFQLFQCDDLPQFYNNINDDELKALLASEEYVAYIFNSDGEHFYVNGIKIKVRNDYSCPSIFALQYHYLNEELLRFKNDSVRKVSSQHFKSCWADLNYIYWVNNPEDSIQLTLAEYLRDSLRGVNVVREYNLGASKPVDVRVFWREANRAALIEVKLMGRSMKKNSNEINSYEYTNVRANDGMKQIKEYIGLGDSDSPNVITKGYLVVVDGRRNNVGKKVDSVSMADGFHYANVELNVDEELQFYNTHNNIEKPIRMFAEPLCS